MFNSNRIIGFALGLAALLLALPALGQNAVPKDESSQSEKQDKNTCISNMAGSSFTLNCARQESGSDKYEDRRNEREELDLVAQRDAANAAADSAWWTQWQVYASALGFIGLGFTFWETRRTANAAIDAVAVARDALGTERAWINFSHVATEVHDFPRTDDGRTHEKGVHLAIRWVNNGRSPAISCIIYGHGILIDMDDPVEEFITKLQTEDVHGAVIGPNQPATANGFIMVPPELDLFINRKKKVILYSKVVYSDVYRPEIVRVSESCMSVVCRGMMPGPNGHLAPVYLIAVAGPQNTCA